MLAFIAALAAPAVAQTSTTATRGTVTNPATIPDGTYTGVVQKVIDNKSVVVKLANGAQATLKTTKDNVDFSKCQANEQIRFSLINGNVAVYAPTTP